VTRTNRKYLLLATGGGKTLLAFEAILPLAKADARAKGKKLVYLTANSNLAAQARIDYRAFKKLLTKLEIITADEFTTRVARGRFLGGERPEDNYVLADEQDKMGEDPVKTVGEESTQIHPTNEPFRGLLDLERKIQGVLGQISLAQRPTFWTHLKRLGRFWLGELFGRVSSDEMAAKAHADLEKLQAEHRELLGKAQMQYTRQVQEFEAAVAAKQKEVGKLEGLLAKATRLGKQGERATLVQRIAKHKAQLESLRQARDSLRAKHQQAVESANRLQELVDEMAAVGSGRKDGTAAFYDRLHAERSRRLEEQTATLERKAATLDREIQTLESLKKDAHNGRTDLDAELIARQLERAYKDRTQVGRDLENLRLQKSVSEAWHRGALQDLQALRERTGKRSPEIGKEGLQARLQELYKKYDTLLAAAKPEEVQKHGTRDPKSDAGRLEKIAREVYNVVENAGGSGHLHESAPGKLRKALDTQKDVLEASSLPEAVKAELRKTLVEMAGLYEAKARSELVKNLSAEYRTTFEKAIEAENPLYEQKAAADREIARWMDSPLRANNAERTDWANAIESTGKDLLYLLERYADSQTSGKDTKLLEEARKLVQKHQELLSKADKPVQGTGPGPEMAGSASLRPRESSPYQIRDQAKVAELEAILEKMIQTAERGGPKEEMRKLADRHAALVPEAVLAVDWIPLFEKALDRMTRKYAGRWADAIWHDPYMGYAEKGKRLAECFLSMLTGRGPVRDWLLNMAYGHLEDPATVRYDGQAKKVFIVHVSGWVENMDTPTRNRWELQYRTALTDRYTHRAKATVRDLTSNKKMNLISYSGTKQERLELDEMDVLGEATQRQPAADRVFQNASQMYHDALKAVQASLKSKTRLTFIGFANTRDLKVFKRALQKSGVPEEAVGQIFSDTEFLRTQRPKAEVPRQMNLNGLKTGKVKVVLVDMRVGGRGIDLDFRSYGKDRGYKGVGYKNVQMYVFNPQEVSPGHYVQFQGRIAPDRLPPGARRRYINAIDLSKAVHDPGLREIAREKGATIDEAFVKEHLQEAQSRVERELLENSEAILRGQSFWKTGLRGLTK